MKKIFSVFLALLIISLSIPLTVTAQENTAYDVMPLMIKQAVASGEINSQKLLKRVELCNTLYKGLKNGETEIDISAIKLSVNDEDPNTILREAIQYVLYMPDIFWINDFKIGFGYRELHKEGTEFWYEGFRILYEPKFIDSYGNPIEYDSTEIKADITDFNKRIDEIAAKVPNEISDIGKLLFLQDYFATNYEYVIDDTTNFNAYNFLLEKKGVCDAYAKAYICVLEKLGIPAMRAVSDEGNHAWTVVKLDGEYYHIDSTWADPTPDILGQSIHDFFLLSDSVLESRDANDSHINWYCLEEDMLLGDISCTSTKYDSGYLWTDTDAAFCYFNGYFYYIGRYNRNGYNAIASLYKTTDFKIRTKVKDVTSDYWYNSGSGEYYFINNNSSLYIMGSQLYYNTSNSVRYLDLLTNEDKELFTVKNINIIGFSYSGNGKFKYTKFFTSGGYSGCINKEYDLPDLGNFNGDSKSIANNLVSMRKYLIEGDTTGLCLLQGDLSGNDGEIDVRDLIAMKKLAASKIA